MTCQWCIYFRRKCGVPSCVWPGGDGRTASPSGSESASCGGFSPRKTCTTCAHRCPEDFRSDMLNAYDVCPKWDLRRLSSWGGYRRRRSGISRSEHSAPPEK